MLPSKFQNCVISFHNVWQAADLYLYLYLWQAASTSHTDHYNRNVRNTGRGIFYHRKYRTLNLAKLKLTWFQVLRNAILARHKYNRITSTKSPSAFMTTFSASLTNLTALLPQSHDRSCYVSRRMPAPPPLWLRKHTDLRAHDFAHPANLWRQPRLANHTAAKAGHFVELILL